jgi:hypothetical protein
MGQYLQYIVLEKIFWPLKWYTDRKWRGGGGGGGGGEVADINLFRKKNFRKWSGTIRKLWTKCANNVQVFNHLNLAALTVHMLKASRVYIWSTLTTLIF